MVERDRLRVILLTCGLIVWAKSAAAVDVVTDGGFEAGPYGGTWTESSLNFGTPICDLASCGTGGGTGPRTGSYWVWLGGFDGIEIALVSQDVTIPAGSAVLAFWLQIPAAAGAGNDVFQVSLDDNVVFWTDNYDPLADMSVYTHYTIDVSDFADGGVHTLEFLGSVEGMGPPNISITNFFVDDVSLTVVPEPAGGVLLGSGAGLLMLLARRSQRLVRNRERTRAARSSVEAGQRASTERSSGTNA